MKFRLYKASKLLFSCHVVHHQAHSKHEPKISQQDVNRIRDLQIRDIRISKRARAQEIQTILIDGTSAQCILGSKNADQEEEMRTFSEYLKQRDRVAIALFPNDMLGLIIPMENSSILHFLVVKAKMTHVKAGEKHASSGEKHHIETEAVLSITQKNMSHTKTPLAPICGEVAAFDTMRSKNTCHSQASESASKQKQLQEFSKRLTYFQTMQFHVLQQWSMTEVSTDHELGQDREQDDT